MVSLTHFCQNTATQEPNTLPHQEQSQGSNEIDSDTEPETSRKRKAAKQVKLVNIVVLDDTSTEIRHISRVNMSYI